MRTIILAILEIASIPLRLIGIGLGLLITAPSIIPIGIMMLFDVIILLINKIIILCKY